VGYSTPVSDSDDAIKTLLAQGSPHVRALGLTYDEVSDGVAVAHLPYRPDLVGDPTSGVLHGGVVTSLLDSVAGAAVFSALSVPEVIATLDLRIDYLRPARPESALWARVECYKLTRHVAFVRGVAHDGSPDDPVASVTATFMRRTSASRAPAPPAQEPS
jgi:uncharacterized protein (TIGR00369 family)